MTSTGWNASAIADGSGGCVVVLEELGASPGIYVRRFNSEGTKLWETRVTIVSPEPVQPQIVARAGDYVLAWVEESELAHSIKLVTIDPSNGTKGTIEVVTENVEGATNLRMSTSDYGGVVLSWIKNGSEGRWARLESDFDVAMSTSAGAEAWVVNDATGGELRVWRYYQSGTGWQLLAMRTDQYEEGWEEPVVVVNQGSTSIVGVTVVSDGAGGAVIVCQSEALPSSPKIIVQWVEYDGDTHWNGAGGLKGKEICPSCTDETTPTLVRTNDGDAVVAWQKRLITPLRVDVYAQKFAIASTLTAQWASTGVKVSSATSDGDVEVRLAPSGADGTAVAWSWYSGDISSVRAQVLDDAGNLTWSADADLAGYSYASDRYVSQPPDAPQVAAAAGGAAFVVWADVDGAATHTHINRLPSPDAMPVMRTPELLMPPAHGNYHYWKLVLDVDGLGAAYPVDVTHGPIDCAGDPTYDRSDDSDAASSHDIALLDDGALNEGQYLKCDSSANNHMNAQGNIDPTTEYFYRVNLGDGMITWDGSVVFDREAAGINYGAITGEAADFSVTTNFAYPCQFSVPSPDSLVENGIGYAIFMEVDDDCATSTANCVDLVHAPERVEIPRLGRYSVGFRAEAFEGIPCEGSTKATQRTEIVHVQDIPFHEVHYQGFSVKIDPSTAMPNRGGIIMQWWQDNEPGPVMELLFEKRDDDMVIVLGRRTSLFGSVCGVNPNGASEELAVVPVVTDNWYDVTLEYRFCPKEPGEGGCGFVQMSVDGDEKVNAYRLLGMPEPWTPQRAISGCITYNPGCGDQGGDIYFDDVRQCVRDLKFGIYRHPWNYQDEGALELYFDEVRLGLSAEDVAIPPLQVEHVTVDPAYDSGTGLWDVTVEFDTEALGEMAEVGATVYYGPDCGESTCSTPLSVASIENDGHHVAALDDLTPGPYCYKIESAFEDETTIIEGRFTVDTGGAKIFAVTSELDTEVCRNFISWKTDGVSSENKLYYKKKVGQATWSSKFASPSSGLQCYSAFFAQSVGMQYKISTKINNVTYESAVFEDLSSCPPMEGDAPKAGQKVAEAFVSAHPNPFNPTVTLTYGVPARQDVELVVYDAAGRRVTTLVSGTVDEGVHHLTWNGTDSAGQTLATGVYFARTRIGVKVITSKLVLLK